MPPARTDQLILLGMLTLSDPRWMKTSLSPVGASRAVSNPGSPATIFAFDVLIRSGSPFVTNQRVFAYPAHGVPMDIACDDKGNVYVGCGNGLQIWSPGGVILGVLEVPGSYHPLSPSQNSMLTCCAIQGGVKAFSFGKSSEIFLCSGQTLWTVNLAAVEEQLLLPVT